MKKFLALSSLLLAINSYSQSYMILNNGVTLTTDKSAFVYDFGHFIAPYKVSLVGGQFLAEEEKLITIDDKGYLYRKDEKVPKKLRGKGKNYLVSESGVLYTVDSQGFYYKFDKDSALKKTTLHGGNFFTATDDKKKVVDLYVVSDKGNYFLAKVADLNPADVATVGGNYFMTTKNTLYTVNKDGFVFAKTDMKVGLIKKLGGNYFVDAAGLLFTVSEDGLLILPALPESLKVSTITKLGSNYFLDKDGKMFTVDHLGNVYERTSKDHNLNDIKILSL